MILAHGKARLLYQMSDLINSQSLRFPERILRDYISYKNQDNSVTILNKKGFHQMEVHSFLENQHTVFEFW